MMYDASTNYVIAILVNNKVLREDKGLVYLPFNSEYSARIKNPHSKRVGVEIFVDGTSITNGKVVISPNSTYDCKRMILDNDLETGPSLKFVPLSNSQVQDPSNCENGVVKVEFYEEYIPKINIYSEFHQYPYKYHPPYYDVYFSGNTPLGSASPPENTGGVTSCSSENTGGWVTSCSNKEVNTFSARSQDGATVSGKIVHQTFISTHFNCCPTPSAILQLKLKGLKHPTNGIFVQKKKYCTNCGKKSKYNDLFCGHCGTKF